MTDKEPITKAVRLDFVTLATADGSNISSLCRRFGISRTTAYKWIHRYEDGGEEALEERSRRPHHSPSRTPEVVEKDIVGIRDNHPEWGARRVRAELERRDANRIPSVSTIHRILKRHGRVKEEVS